MTFNQEGSNLGLMLNMDLILSPGTNSLQAPTSFGNLLTVGMEGAGRV